MLKAPFYLQEPRNGERPVICSLHADVRLIEYAERLDCVHRVTRFGDDEYVHLWLDPRYDWQEAWLFIYMELETEARNTDLDPLVWDKALE